MRLDCVSPHKGEFWKGFCIRSSIERQKSTTIQHCLRPYQEVRNESLWFVAILPTPRGIDTETFRSQAPGSLSNLPRDLDLCFAQKT